MDDICELCAIGQDPFATNFTEYHDAKKNYISVAPHSGNSSSKRKILIEPDSYQEDGLAYSQPQNIPVYTPGQVPVVANPNYATPIAIPVRNQPTTTGIVKNVKEDCPKKLFITKWFRSLFTGHPLPLDDDVTMFQVFPDYASSTFNAQGNACDQVIVYGRLKKGLLCENNDVEVYGNRDSSNNIVAKKVINKASGTSIIPERTLSAGLVWFITLLAVSGVVAFVMNYGTTGLIWAGVIILCLTNLPLVFKIMGVIFGIIFAIFFGRRR